MQNEALSVEVPTGLYIDMVTHLRKTGDQRTPRDVVALALRNWLNMRAQTVGTTGYQWKNLFLPDGTELRIRYRGVYYYATIRGDRLMYCGESLSPRSWTLMISGTVRNPWRDIWLRRRVTETWTRADTWRKTGTVGRSQFGNVERRSTLRRWTD